MHIFWYSILLMTIFSVKTSNNKFYAYLTIKLKMKVTAKKTRYTHRFNQHCSLLLWHLHFIKVTLILCYVLYCSFTGYNYSINHIFKWKIRKSFNYRQNTSNEYNYVDWRKWYAHLAINTTASEYLDLNSKRFCRNYLIPKTLYYLYSYHHVKIKPWIWLLFDIYSFPLVLATNHFYVLQISKNGVCVVIPWIRWCKSCVREKLAAICRSILSNLFIS